MASPGTVSRMPLESLTPIRFAPIFKTAVWGGTRLRSFLNVAPSPEPTGEAWILSDHASNQTIVACGPLAGTTFRQLLEQHSQHIARPRRLVNGRFPILLKFIDAREPLSVQVHPNDLKARKLEGAAAVGKTEAWVVLEAKPSARLYTGLRSGTTPGRLRNAIVEGGLEQLLYAHVPATSDCLFLPAGTVHSIGGGLLLFEIQQTSDLTYRLYDWGRVDPLTGKSRELHVEKGLASIDFAIGPCWPSSPTAEGRGRVRRARLVDSDYFSLGRWDADKPFQVGAAGKCRVLVGIGGRAMIQYAGVNYPIGPGDVWLLPAEVGECECVSSETVALLECGLVE